MDPTSTSWPTIFYGITYNKFTFSLVDLIEIVVECKWNSMLLSWSQQPDVRFLLSTGSTVAIQTIQRPPVVSTLDTPDKSCGNKNNLVTSYKLTDTTWHDYRTLRIQIYPKNPGFSLYSHDRLGWDFRTLDPIRSGGVYNLPPASKTTWVSVWPVTPSASMDTCCFFFEGGNHDFEGRCKKKTKNGVKHMKKNHGNYEVIYSLTTNTSKKP